MLQDQRNTPFENETNTCYKIREIRLLKMRQIHVTRSEKYALHDPARSWLVSAGVQTESGAWGKDQFPAPRPQPLSQPTFRCITLRSQIISSALFQ